MPRRGAKQQKLPGQIQWDKGTEREPMVGRTAPYQISLVPRGSGISDLLLNQPLKVAGPALCRVQKLQSDWQVALLCWTILVPS